jgi:hypothetical protein
MYDLSFVENKGLFRNLGDAVLRVAKHKNRISGLPKYLVGLYELVLCLKKHIISVPLL